MDGFLNVLKPRGVTSHDVVAVVRGILRDNRVGHLGTLDPPAVGVLPLVTGAYRRLSEYFLVEDKRYLAEFTFGVSTDTGDTDGRIQTDVDASNVARERVDALLGSYRGRIYQVPPAFSALKVGGRKMLELAREGVVPRKAPREVVVHSLSLVSWKEGRHPVGLFDMTVGRGTYVRSLAQSIGEDLGCGAAVSYLLRVRSGRFHLKDALTIGQLRELKDSDGLERALSDPLSVLPTCYPTVRVLPQALKKLAHGVPLRDTDFLGGLPASLHGRTVMVMSWGSTLRDSIVAVVRPKLPGRVVYEKVLCREND